MIIGSVCENKASEKRISVTPDNVKKFVSNGFKVYLEKNYADHLDIDDKRFLENGAEIFSDKDKIIKESDILLQLNLPDEKDLEKLSYLFFVFLFFNLNFEDFDETFKINTRFG